MDTQVHGVVTGDPIKGAINGDKLSFGSMLFPPIAAPGAGDLEQWNYFGSALLSIAFKSGDDVSVEGSAAMVGPGLALAAKHVLEPHLANMLTETETPVLLSIVGGGLQIWRLHQIIFTDTDVAILRIDLASPLPENNQFHMTTLTTRTPRIGEHVQIAGFRCNIFKEGAIHGQTRIGIGEITAVYPQGRDVVMHPHPCIEVKCLTIGGMSGGPAFDEKGRLLGILGTSFEDNEGPSYVSLAWPTFGAKIESAWLTGSVQLPTTLVEMAAAGLVGMEAREAFSIISDKTAQLVAWS
jgi:hypothetical protein